MLLGISHPTFANIKCNSIARIFSWIKPNARKENLKTAKLFTERFEIRQLNAMDIPSVTKLISDPEVQNMSGDYHWINESTVRSQLQTLQHIYARMILTQDYFEMPILGLKIVMLGVFENGNLLGVTQIFRGSRRFESEGLNLREAYFLGYHFFPSEWGKGIATEVGERMVRYAFESLGISRMHATVLKSNVGSQNVLKKLGFQEVRTKHPDVSLLALDRSK